MAVAEDPFSSSSEWETVSDSSASGYEDESGDDLMAGGRRKRPAGPTKRGTRAGVRSRPETFHLELVKSYREVHETDRIEEAYAVKIPPGAGAPLSKLLQSKGGTPEEKLFRQLREAMHLRRFVRRNMLPDYIKTTVTPEEVEPGQQPSNDIGRLYFLACLTTTMPLAQLITAMEPFVKPTWPRDDLQVRRVLVNLSPPLTDEVAQRDCRDYWPATNKKTNPFGPQHTAVAAALADVQPIVKEYMDLAKKVAAEGAALKLGPAIGAVIATKDHKIVAVACDTRHAPRAIPHEGDASHKGNPLCHSVLRAISMVARQRRNLDTTRANVRRAIENEREDDVFCDKPLTDLERQAASVPSELDRGGYLCLHLDVYLTHEPCAMCSMALLHSRFNRVIIGKQVPDTGGLIAHPNRGYGLGWREELNWRFVTFEWKSDRPAPASGKASGEAEGYHA